MDLVLEQLATHKEENPLSFLNSMHKLTPKNFKEKKIFLHSVLINVLLKTKMQTIKITPLAMLTRRTSGQQNT
jgi:hypothetical protein